MWASLSECLIVEDETQSTDIKVLLMSAQGRHGNRSEATNLQNAPVSVA